MIDFYPPQKGEYSPYFDSYLSLNPNKNFSELIHSQVEEFQLFFEQKPEAWADTPYQLGKWTPKEVLGHIIDTERIMTFRALCFSRGDQNSLPGFDQDPYVLNAKFGAVSLALLLEDFEAQRKALLTFIQTLPKESLDHLGTANGSKITPRALFWIIPGHFIHHFTILKNRY